jgi:hypothetical protein
MRTAPTLLLTVPEAAAELGVPVRRVRAMLRAGELPFVRLPWSLPQPFAGRRLVWRVDLDLLRGWGAGGR